MLQPQVILRDLFDRAVAAASDWPALGSALPACEGRVRVIGAGKAAAAMAARFEHHHPDLIASGRLDGFVVVPDGHAAPTLRLEVITASHPTPDARSMAAGLRALRDAEALGPDDLLVTLMSGGGSALMVAPVEGVSLDDKIRTSRILLASGLPIETVNAVRRRLSRIKGGGLAGAAAPATVVTFVVSDVPGDDPSLVASGPTVAAPAAPLDLPRSVLERLVAPVRAQLDRPLEGEGPSGAIHLLATADGMLDAAARHANRLGLHVINLGGAVQGEARDVAVQHAARAVAYDGPLPAVILSGGETTVTVRGHGCGGRNTEYLLALALALRGRAGVYALAADTDGVDGQGGVAGAFCDPTTLRRADALGLSADAMLADNDSHACFEALGNTLVTGPTRTNVNDFRAILLM